MYIQYIQNAFIWFVRLYFYYVDFFISVVHLLSGTYDYKMLMKVLGWGGLRNNIVLSVIINIVKKIICGKGENFTNKYEILRSLVQKKET